jgi:hypothetical protein
MTIITLTKQDTPSRPITLNTDFIAAVNPLRKAVPDPNSQTMQTRTVYAGSEVVLSNGTRYNVLESYPDVVAKLSPPSFNPEPMPEAHQRATPAAAPPNPPGTVLAASGVPQLANTVTTTDSDAQPESLDVLPTPIPEPDPADELVTATEDAGLYDHQPEPPAGTPLTEEELAAVAEHEAKPEATSSPKPAKKAAAKKVTRQKDQVADQGGDDASQDS